jgi:iron complex transport system substrate-binding protein
VSAFTSANLDLKPDVVFTFSDLQADIAAGLIRHGIELHAINHPPGSSALRAHGH